jgi:hypothetical protein
MWKKSSAKLLMTAKLRQSATNSATAASAIMYLVASLTSLGEDRSTGRDRTTALWHK